MPHHEPRKPNLGIFLRIASTRLISSNFFGIAIIAGTMPYPQTLEAKPKCIFFTDFDGMGLGPTHAKRGG